MKKVITAIVAAVIVGLMAFGYWHTSQSQAAEEELDPQALIFEHLGDAYGWELPFSHDIKIPLPIIVKDAVGTWHVFSSSRVTGGQEYEGFKIAESGDNKGKVVTTGTDGQEYRPLDLSVTKNVAGAFIAAIFVIIMAMSLKRWYVKHGMKAPRKMNAFIEVVVDFVYMQTIRPILGKNAPKYGPYLLTVFFFILTMNLLGLTVIFPGGANLTGNLAVTMTLAIITFFLINFTKSKEYWKDIFWPDMPMAFKCPVPLMQVIEVFSAFIKPIALMVRLFANMIGGHMAVLVFIMLIFTFGAFGTVFSVVTTPVSLAFSLFMLLLDTLVSFIQAYVFTILSTMFISMSHPVEEEN